MESLSPSVRDIKIPLSLPIPAYLRDHRHEGRAVLPAVEALQILARSLPGEISGCHPLLQETGEFARLLPVEEKAETLNLFHELAVLPDGRRQSRLMSLHPGRQVQLNRRMTHVSVTFSPVDEREAAQGDWPASCSGATTPGPSEERADGSSSGLEPIRDITTERSGAVFTIRCEDLYADLVPFGPAYHNVTGEVGLTKTGVRATVSGGGFPEAVGPLGSPFPFDAAMHMACAWGQRYHNIVSFPVGFYRREIVHPTAAGKTYLCRVFALPEEGPVLRFDVRMFDEQGRPAEIILGLRMRDISGGRLKPPAWVRRGV